MIQNRAELERLLKHEHQLVKRYRYYLSVVLMASRGDQFNINELLSDTVRASDQFLALEEFNIVFMAHTGLDGAHKAVDRFRQRCNGGIELRYSIASYPGDVMSPAKIMAVAEQRLQEAILGGEAAEAVGNGSE